MKGNRLKELDHELDVLMESMRAVPPDSDVYLDLLKRYEELLRLREELKPAAKGWSIADSILDKGIRIAGSIGVPLFLGWLAYSGDRELKMANGRVWNLVGKKFDQK